MYSKKKKIIDPFSRIIMTSDDGEIVRVFFDLPREIFDLIVDLASLFDFDVDKVIIEAIKTFSNKFNAGIVESLEDEIRSKDEEISSLRKTVEQLTEMIKDLSDRITSYPITVQGMKHVPKLQSSRKIDMPLDIPELTEVSESIQSAEEERASIDDVLDDVLVVAIDEDLLDSDIEESNDEKDDGSNK